MTIFKHCDFEVPEAGEFAAGPSSWAGYAQQVLALNPLCYWRLGEAGGAAAAQDLGALGLHGAYTGGVTLGEPGALVRDADPAALFDGVSGYVDCGAVNPLAGATACTILFWLRHTGPVSKDGAVLGCYSGAGWAVWVDDVAFESGRANTLTLALGGLTGTPDSRLEGPADLIAPGQWDFYAFTYQGGEHLRLYRNGERVSNYEAAAVRASVMPSSNHLQIASSQHASIRHLAAAVDEAAIFGHALTGAQIADLHRRGRGIFQLTA